MSNVIEFPNLNTNQKIALYTQNHIYIGTIEKREPLPEGTGIWLLDVTVAPIKGQVTSSEILCLDSVCVLWNQVVAFSNAPTLGPQEYCE